ncbi:M15 family metallopeptidase [Streptacidiphilus sp. PB12-B1b]|uniref:M15 family metallopeptidase n=1 Tax=Streptacidiphilus sp. PB12-B1b TaxID=2705012 RepID=UPI00351A10F9
MSTAPAVGRTRAILMSAPRITAIPVQECGERLVDLRLENSITVDPRRQDLSGAYAHVRSSVAGLLLAAQAALPSGTLLLVIEGYRPPGLQDRYFREYADALRARNSHWDDEQLHAATSRFVSPSEIEPHTAGAAVDVTLVTANGRELDLGSRVGATPEESEGDCFTRAADLTERARTNRALLCRVLESAGLVNNGLQWWQWSYGDPYWAMATDRRAAIYGPTPSLHDSTGQRR